MNNKQRLSLKAFRISTELCRNNCAGKGKYCRHSSVNISKTPSPKSLSIKIKPYHQDAGKSHQKHIDARPPNIWNVTDRRLLGIDDLDIGSIRSK